MKDEESRADIYIYIYRKTKQMSSILALRSFIQFDLTLLRILEIK